MLHTEVVAELFYKEIPSLLFYNVLFDLLMRHYFVFGLYTYYYKKKNMIDAREKYVKYQ